MGRTGTPYEGGWFRVDVTAPERYPFEPLKMKFITKVRPTYSRSCVRFIMRNELIEKGIDVMIIYGVVGLSSKWVAQLVDSLS